MDKVALAILNREMVQTEGTPEVPRAFSTTLEVYWSDGLGAASIEVA
jgi:hypothetical protein